MVKFVRNSPCHKPTRCRFCYTIRTEEHWARPREHAGAPAVSAWRAFNHLATEGWYYDPRSRSFRFNRRLGPRCRVDAPGIVARSLGRNGGVLAQILS